VVLQVLAHAGDVGHYALDAGGSKRGGRADAVHLQCLR